MTHGSLFTGVGAFDWACTQHGIENVFGCDIDPFSQAHYKLHFPDWTFEGLYGKAAGNSIYFPLAKIIVGNVKKHL